jgi:hypothetical protein
MRHIVNITAGLCVLVLVGILWIKAARDADDAHRIAATMSAMRQIEQTIRYKVEYQGLEANAKGWPMTVDRNWFEQVPRSVLVGPENPWLEIAPQAEANFKHPPVRLAVGTDLAGLWYNPYLGILRARVPVQVSDAKSAALYNQVNGTSLKSILEPENGVLPMPFPPKAAPAPTAAASPPATPAAPPAATGSEPAAPQQAEAPGTPTEPEP